MELVLTVEKQYSSFNEEVLDELMEYINSNFDNLYLEAPYIYTLVKHIFIAGESYRLENRIENGDIISDELDDMDPYSPDFDDLIKETIESILGYYVERSSVIDEIKQLSKYPQFRDIFDNFEDLIPKSGTKLKQFNEVSEIIYQFVIRDQDILDDEVLDTLYEWDIEKSRNIPEFNTVPQINELMAKITSSNYYDDYSKIGLLKEDELPKVESIYDGFYGLGGSTNAVSKYISGKKWGQEINQDMYNLFNFYWSCDKETIVNDDSLYNSSFFDKEFDIIVSQPPYNPKGKLTDMEKKLLGVKGINNVRNNSSWIHVLSSLFNLKKDGIMAMTLTLGTLSNGLDKHLREDIIINKNALDAVIVLPPKLAKDTSIPVCVLVFKKNRKPEDKISFIDASKCYEFGKGVNILTDESIDKIVETYVNKVEIERFSSLASIDEIKENDFNLTIARYVDTFEGKNIKLDEVISKKKELNLQLDEINKKIDDLTSKMEIKN